eukprot:1239120-Amphidinium_carterae.1
MTLLMWPFPAPETCTTSSSNPELKQKVSAGHTTSCYMVPMYEYSAESDKIYKTRPMQYVKWQTSLHTSTIAWRQSTADCNLLLHSELSQGSVPSLPQTTTGLSRKNLKKHSDHGLGALDLGTLVTTSHLTTGARKIHVRVCVCLCVCHLCSE